MVLFKKDVVLFEKEDAKDIFRGKLRTIKSGEI